MTSEWKPSADEDVFSQALRGAYDAHWRAVNSLQSENEELRRKVMTTTGVPLQVAGDDLHIADDKLQLMPSAGTSEAKDSNLEGMSSSEVRFETKERLETKDSSHLQLVATDSMTSSMAPVEAKGSMASDLYPRISRELLSLPPGASVPTQRNAQLNRLQVLASGGESDPPDSMDDCVGFGFVGSIQSGISNRELGRITISSDLSFEEPAMDWNGSVDSKVHCIYELREQWHRSTAFGVTLSELGLTRSLSQASRQSSNVSSQVNREPERTPRPRAKFLRWLPRSLQDVRCIHPESSKRIFWDVCSVALLVYDCVMLPLSFFEFGFGSWTKPVGFASTVFWTVDIFASFGTGVYTNGVLHTSPGIVAYHYVKRWLCFDAVVTGLEWALFFLGADESEGAASISGIRILRFFRFVRILRAIKLSVLAKKLSRRVNNVTIMLVLRLLGHLALLVMINHATAALWYGIGEIGRSSDGWMVSFKSRSPLFLYLSSLHWSITNFHGAMEVNPGNERERAFACFVLLMGIVGFSTFVGSITNSISMVQKFHEVRTRKYHLLCKYLIKQNISGALCAKAKRCFEEQMMLSQQEEDIDIATVLSGDILEELHEEARTRHTMSNSLFCYFILVYPRVVRQLCKDAMGEEYARRGHNFFFYGDACERVLILTMGIARYIHNSEENLRSSANSAQTAHASLHSLSCDAGETVHDERWISEMVLWAQWVCCGWLGALSECHALTIDHTSFGHVVTQYEHARRVACDYARKLIDWCETHTSTDLLEATIVLNLKEWQPSPRPVSKLRSRNSSSSGGALFS